MKIFVFNVYIYLNGLRGPGILHPPSNGSRISHGTRFSRNNEIINDLEFEFEFISKPEITQTNNKQINKMRIRFL